MKIMISLTFLFHVATTFAQTLPAKSAAEKFLQDTLITVKANSEAGFNYDYLLFIPEGTVKEKKTWLLVEPNNSGFTSDSIERHRQAAKSLASESSIGNNISSELKIPFLVPIFPRPESRSIIYTHALDRDVMLAQDEDFNRPDLQLIQMIKDAQSRLEELQVPVEEKVLMTGFSASGSFVNRFTLLHPEMVKATSAGGLNGILMLPKKELNGVKLNYPLGINDIYKFIGKEADLETYKKVPQFIFMGALDDNDAVPNDDAYNNKEREVIFATVGKKMQPDRWEKCQQIYKDEGVNAIFRTYPQVGHWTTGEINLEVIRFFMEQMKSN